jgi:penicillin-binding protein 1A
MANSGGSSRPAGTRVVLRVARFAGIVVLFVVVALLGTLGGVLFAYAGDLPEITALDNYKPNTITRLMARDGQEIAQFATERRVVVTYDQIAPVLRQAIIAKEDADFEKHFGLSIWATGRAIVVDLLTGERKGGSTITQQVARDLFLREYMKGGGVYARTGFEGLERKVKEWLVSMQIERRYTKREIFTIYANQIYLAHGAYGVEAGARLYFDKSAKELNLEEAALIAAIIESPERLSPFVDPRRAVTRRNYVLQRMAEEHYITPEQSREAQERPLVLMGQPTPERSIAPYFVEDIRKMLEQKYGAKALYEAGLRVQTTLDADLQEAANAAVDRGLRRLDKKHAGWRKPTRNILNEHRQIDRFTTDRWSRPILAGDIVPALVTFVPPKGSSAMPRVRIAQHEIELPKAAYAWTRKTAPADLFTVGDMVEVEVRTIDAGKPGQVFLEQPPNIEGALLAIDNHTGQIRAMVGGFSFARSKFNRATQARRQVGSLFKPFVYTAAIDRGFTPISVFIDEPIAYPAGPNQPPYSPQNFDRKFEGAVTLRHALEDSRNVPAVKAMAEVGPENVVGYAKRFGLHGNFPPYLSLALGAAEATLVDMTSAYTVFPNQGVRMQPYAVTTIADREGNVLEENRPEPHEAIRADTAFVMTNLLRGVVQRGTGQAAAALDWPLAGKTGTVDDYTDAWFIGFDPNVTVGVWVGYDEKKPIGNRETGAQAALPIWMEFVKAYIDKRANRDEPPQFEAPGNIVMVTLDSGITEAFINGTQPQAAGVVPASSQQDSPQAAAPAVQ